MREPFDWDVHHGFNVNFPVCEWVQEDSPSIRNRYLCHLRSCETLLIHPNVVARIPEVPHEVEDAFGHGIDWVHSGMEGVFFFLISSQAPPRRTREWICPCHRAEAVRGMSFHTAVGALTVVLGLQTSWVDRRTDAHAIRKCTTFADAVADALLHSSRVWR